MGIENSTSLEKYEKIFPAVISSKEKDRGSCEEIIYLLENGYGIVNSIKNIQVDGEVLAQMGYFDKDIHQRLQNIFLEQLKRFLKGEIKYIRLEVGKVIGYDRGYIEYNNILISKINK